jgi:dephospho-CoA kinase
VGLTGGIGAGKSTVATRLAARGALVVDADRIAREVVAPGTPGLADLVEAFGTGVLADGGGLDRSALGRLVFADATARRRLEEITHPRIAARTARLVAGAPAQAVVVHDVPLLVEKRMGAGYHLVVVVHAPEGERLRRLVALRGLPVEEAQARVGAQADDAARRAVGDVWLENVGAPAELLAQVDRLWDERLVPFEENVRLRRRARRATLVTVAAPDPDWPRQATRLAARVVAATGCACVRVDHTGSTAVPGLAAKDLVDLQLVVPDLGAADGVRTALEDAGFVRLEGRWWDEGPGGERLPKRVHVACDPGRSVNLHVRAETGPAWRDQLLFRDWLRAHPDERDAYATIKRAAAGVDLGTYLAGKGPWITDALARARAWADESGWKPEPAPSW